jgi:hypothetical protein
MKEKPAGAAVEEGKNCRWGGTVLKNANKQYHNEAVSKRCCLFLS